MPILWRSWITLSTIIGFVLGVFSLFSALQHNAILASLIEQRVAVMAQSTAEAFRPVVNMGLPISMLRNADAILARVLEEDPEVQAVHVFNPAGIRVLAASGGGVVVQIAGRAGTGLGVAEGSFAP